MSTPQWIKKLGGHAGELYVAAELSKRGIPNALLPENFSDDDILIGGKDGRLSGYVQVKACHPDRAESFRLGKDNEEWVKAGDNDFIVFVWLGSPEKNETPRFWITTKRDAGNACIKHTQHNTDNPERRFFLPDKNGKQDKLNASWENNWGLFKAYLPAEE